jgi:transcriptional regulator
LECGRALNWKTTQSFDSVQRSQVDRDVALCGPEKSARIELGLALLERRCEWGKPVTQDEIAAWCGCSRSAIWQIEKRALRKIRKKAGALLTSEIVGELDDRIRS